MLRRVKKALKILVCPHENYRTESIKRLRWKNKRYRLIVIQFCLECGRYRNKVIY